MCDVVTGNVESNSSFAWQIMDYGGPGIWGLRVSHGYLDTKYAYLIAFKDYMLTRVAVVQDLAPNRRTTCKLSATPNSMPSPKSMLALESRFVTMRCKAVRAKVSLRYQ
jgi:hypothetical protein